MCGEHADKVDQQVVDTGSSPHVRGALKWHIGRRLCYGDHPRMCGEHAMPLRWPAFRVGSSPHVRGALKPTRSAAGEAGIIPACAGSTVIPGVEERLAGDHPRMCGEHRQHGHRRDRLRGSSPHVRGALS